MGFQNLTEAGSRNGLRAGGLRVFDRLVSVFDDFEDGVFDTTDRWEIIQQDIAPTESNGRLLLECGTDGADTVVNSQNDGIKGDTLTADISIVSETQGVDMQHGYEGPNGEAIRMSKSQGTDGTWDFVVTDTDGNTTSTNIGSLGTGTLSTTIEWTPGSQAILTVDGTEEANITTNVPDVQMYVYMSVGRGAAYGSTVEGEWFVLEVK